MLFTLSIGIVIGTLISSGVKAAKDNRSRARTRRRWSIPEPGRTVQRIHPDRQAGGALRGEYFHHVSAEAGAAPAPRGGAR